MKKNIKVEFLYLNREDVLSLGLSMKEVITEVEKGLVEHGKKKVEMPPKPGIHTFPDAFIHAMPIYIPKYKAAGMKWVSGYPQARKYGLPYIMGILVLNDAGTGAPYAIMECGFETAMRTGAVTGIAAKYLAKKNSQVVGICGLGEQAIYQLLALKETVNFKIIKAYDIFDSAKNKFVEKMSKNYNLNIVAAKTAEDAVAGSDIVITACSENVKPFVKKEWLKEGVLGLPIELNLAWTDEAIFSVDKIILDDWKQFSEHVKRTGRKIPGMYSELGEIIAGIKPGRKNDKEKIWNSNYGLSVHDAMVGKLIYKKAINKGIGKKLRLL
ncbi:MAG: ornithine cyclodeaminase family protein [Elusimicrobia bacterium]|nr:ornithine cyclodeaminase family protein [Elusimicrobiota bacterium]